MGIKVVAASDIVKHMDGLVHEPTQAAAGRRLDLTVRQVYKQEGPGALDFGGSEYVEAPRSEVAVQRASPEDAHGWWLLEEGDYLIGLNESIAVPSGSAALLVPHPRLLANGVSHPTLLLTEKESIPAAFPLHVGEHGVRLKQNARLSSLVVFD